VYPFLFSGRLTVAKQSTDGYTTYLLKHNFCLYLNEKMARPTASGKDEIANPIGGIIQ